MAPDKAIESRQQDVSELLQTGEPVVFAVDQVPFEVESRGVKNTFCLLVPLMTDSGLELDRSQFRNRERVWWMLRPEIPAHQIQVGTVWSGPIERSRAYGKPEKEKDHYQVRRGDIRPGARHLVEVLNINVAHPDLAELLSPEGIAWPYPPLSRVIVRGGLSVVGPFRASYDFGTQRVVLNAIAEDDPHVYRLTQAEFESNVRVREYSYTANQWDAKAQEREIHLSFLYEDEIQVFPQRGEQLDGATDTQVVNWALGFLDIPEESREHFRSVLTRTAALDGRVTDGFHDRMSRFLKLCENRERVVGLGSDVAKAVADHGGFRDLIQKHIESITAERVQEAIAKRRQDVEVATEEAEKKLVEVRELIAQLELEYESTRASWDEKFQRQFGERVAELEAREERLARQEREMEERLRHLIETYRDSSREFSEHIFAEIPILQRLGMLSFGAAERSGSQPAEERGARPVAPIEIELPQYLSQPKPLPASPVEEERFLDHFRAVVDHNGFVFDADDLANFHVLVKTGLWTVLAGASGLGKSSLPRLYADALGSSDEFLMVPVRPDWLDDRDVIGAFNALSGRYEPAPCGLVDRLIVAHEDEKVGRGGIYIICVDEMNLARVEHYFAQFLSVLEQPEDARYLQLFSRGVLDPGDPYARYRDLKLGQNIRLVGTVNVDETTHFFSPKVIDRVSIAHFERPDLREGLEEDESFVVDERPTMEPIHLDTYLSWVRAPDRSGEAVQVVLKVEEILRRSRLGLGFRVRDRILRYVSSARTVLGEERAIDFAILQNVLPGLRPTAPRYMELLKDLRTLFPEGRFRRTGQMLHALEEDSESDFFQLL